MARSCKLADKIVCCEYNRAHITKGLFQLDSLPFVLPNKVYIDDNELDYIPNDVRDILGDVLERMKDKKVVLYQGIFLDKERRLEEFCQAVNSLSDEYLLVAMGGGSSLFEQLKEKYESEKIIFVPFIRPPYHLLVTKMASVGILSYFPRPNNVASVINPLYCAPNKIFEYAKFSVPMIANDIPALHYAFTEHRCGKCVSYPMETSSIKDTLLEIFDNYDEYSSGALDYYNSIDLKKILQNMLN
jgi:glycosyltransferase involved in cell wall biosynthesis